MTIGSDLPDKGLARGYMTDSSAIQADCARVVALLSHEFKSAGAGATFLRQSPPTFLLTTLTRSSSAWSGATTEITRKSRRYGM